MKLIFGLGNPGSEYVGSRHNVGFEVIDALAAKLGFAREKKFDLFAKSKFQALSLDGPVKFADGQEDKVMLLKPMTYMNESGRSVKSAIAFFQIPLEDLLVVSDDLALPCGQLRLRPDGSSGGHNGLANIQQALGTPRYPRLRIGIDAKPAYIPQRDYVLGKFSADQRPWIDAAVPRAVDAVLCWMEKGITTAMNRYNESRDKGQEAKDK